MRIVNELLRLPDSAQTVGPALVETVSLIAFLDRAQPWTPSDRGAAARARRIEVARAALRP